MASLPAINVSECDPNTPLLTKHLTNSSASYRSSSVKLSMRASTSRITLVGYDADLEPKFDVPDGTTSNVKEWSRLDHLLAVFCINRRPKPRATAPERRAEPGNREMGLDRSPWVLPVYVLSRERDEYRHLLPKEGKCTIDTGNLQGNIVSKAFLVDVLGYTETDFHRLTKEEEDGGAGITGHKLIPGGAVYLTWYHSNSTRVFRDMRFLISEHPMHDLIIGARSIRKHNILDVPNLVNGGGGGGRADQKKRPTTENLDKRESVKLKANDEMSRWKGKKEDKVADGKSVPTDVEENLTKWENEFHDAKKNYEEELEEFCLRGVADPTIAKGHWTDQDYKELFKVKTKRDLPSNGESKGESKGETKKGK